MQFAHSTSLKNLPTWMPYIHTIPENHIWWQGGDRLDWSIGKARERGAIGLCIDNEIWCQAMLDKFAEMYGPAVPKPWDQRKHLVLDEINSEVIQRVKALAPDLKIGPWIGRVELSDVASLQRWDNKKLITQPGLGRVSDFVAFGCYYEEGWIPQGVMAPEHWRVAYLSHLKTARKYNKNDEMQVWLNPRYWSGEKKDTLIPPEYLTPVLRLCESIGVDTVVWWDGPSWTDTYDPTQQQYPKTWWFVESSREVMNG